MERDGDWYRFAVRQHRWRPLVRWALLAAVTLACSTLYALALARGVPPDWWWRVAMIAGGLVLFVAVLAVIVGLLAALSQALLRRSHVVFRAGPGGIRLNRPARRGQPRAVHRDEVAGPFVRVDDVIDAEASANTMMRMGGDEIATALAEGARTGGGADTLTWWLFSASAASVTITRRGVSLVLAESLTRDKAEELADAVGRVLRGASPAP